MSGEDVRAAAEAVLNCPPTAAAWASEPGRLIPFALKCARAWLAEHPADDAEPVTADWLRAVGIVHGCFDPLCYGYHHGKGCFTLNITSELGSVSSIDVPTRGHVRRLCAALGITITGAV
jgi:hypothetical protein